MKNVLSTKIDSLKTMPIFINFNVIFLFGDFFSKMFFYDNYFIIIGASLAAMRSG